MSTPLYARTLAAALTCAPTVWAQSVATPAATPSLQQCQATQNDTARLACFDAWSRSATPTNVWQAPSASANNTATHPPLALHTTDATPAANGGCRDASYSEVSRFFELERGSDCGNFSLRGYRPISLSVISSERINNRPYSPHQGFAPARDYDKEELRIQLSVRTKIASGIFTPPDSDKLDSLWVGYSQQSYWQVFNGDISSPFRNTDHEPEIFYIYPTDAALPGGWRWRYSGIGLVHQSNGQSNPLSRNWDRWYLVTGAELDRRWHVQAKIWQRIKERGDFDDNSDITKYMGRGELKVGWNVNPTNALALQLRGNLTGGKASAQLEWMRPIGQGFKGHKSNLRLYARLFSGYGESIIDYNFKRTSLAVGLSLLDF